MAGLDAVADAMDRLAVADFDVNPAGPVAGHLDVEIVMGGLVRVPQPAGIFIGLAGEPGQAGGPRK